MFISGEKLARGPEAPSPWANRGEPSFTTIAYKSSSTVYVRNWKPGLGENVENVHADISVPWEGQLIIIRLTFFISSPYSEGTNRDAISTFHECLRFRGGHLSSCACASVAEDVTMIYTSCHSLHMTGINWTSTWPASGEASKHSQQSTAPVSRMSWVRIPLEPWAAFFSGLYL